MRFTSPLQLAVSSGDVSIVRLLLENGALTHVECRRWSHDRFERPAMHLAAIQCCHDMKKKNSNEPSLEIIDELLKFGANPSEGLHGAIGEHNIKVVRYLLEKGADPTFIDGSDNGIDMAASVVIKKRIVDFSIINLLLQYGATVNLKSSFCKPALLQAIASNSIELLRFLLANGGRRALNEKHSHATGKMFRPSDCSARDVLLEVGAKECGGFLAFESRDPNVLNAVKIATRPAPPDYFNHRFFDCYNYDYDVELNADCPEVLPAEGRSKGTRRALMHTKRPNCRKFRKPMRTCPIDYPVSGC
eukprot:TRINITY_DN323_c2_g1_i2.p1 TRINITY_DN323_c2_g1~~TRINITY_DN323_c2_g1_i2.p1  ORF type:complete len:304 (+),score=43.89 TRINITY_DN323_c2_g1_i2:31-942(+)